MVSGNNRYFALSTGRARELDLQPTDLLPLSPPGSRHLRALTFTTAQWRALGHEGHRIWLFRPESPSPGAAAYIAQGEAAGVDAAYKCRVRKPWWRTPYLRPADLTLTYMNADTPRLVTNRAGVHHLNSVHGVYLRTGLRQIGMGLLPLASLNSATLLGAEIVGRAYGGGLLKIEPGEADRLPMPGPALVRASASALRRIRQPARRLVVAGRLEEAVALVDEVVLVGGLGMAPAEVDLMRAARRQLLARRVARGREVRHG